MGIPYHVRFNFCVHCFVRNTFQDIFHTHFTEFTPIIYTRQYFSPTTLYWKKLKKHQIRSLSVLPPPDVYLKENQAQHMVIIHNDSLPAPSITTQPERKEIPTSPTRQEPTT